MLFFVQAITGVAGQIFRIDRRITIIFGASPVLQVSSLIFAQASAHCYGLSYSDSSLYQQKYQRADH
jgi:hypothetical protein